MTESTRAHRSARAGARRAHGLIALMLSVSGNYVQKERRSQRGPMKRARGGLTGKMLSLTLVVASRSAQPWFVGETVGVRLGALLGDTVGARLGALLGDTVGARLGALLGDAVRAKLL